MWTWVQLVGLAVFAVGCVLVAGVGGGLVAVGLVSVFVGVAGERGGGG